MVSESHSGIRSPTSERHERRGPALYHRRSSVAVLRDLSAATVAAGA